MEQLNLALGQVSNHREVEKNLELAQMFSAMAAQGGADLLVLPEMFMALPEKGQSLNNLAQPLNGPFVTALGRFAASHSVAIVAGVWEDCPGTDRVYNTAVMLSPEGELLGAYRKLHLFDALSLKESDTMVRGEEPPPVIALKGHRVGLSICYDLRFPELFRCISRNGADLVLVPSAWYAGPLKEDHWLTLLRARAIENTMYVAGANLTGAAFCGRSTVFDPFGVPLAGAGEDERLVLATVRKERVKEVRTKLPCLANCRFGISELL